MIFFIILYSAGTNVDSSVCPTLFYFYDTLQPVYNTLRGTAVVLVFPANIFWGIWISGVFQMGLKAKVLSVGLTNQSLFLPSHTGVVIAAVPATLFTIFIY